MGFEPFYLQLAPITVARFRAMRHENWLGSYGSIQGMELTLARVSQRFQRATNLVPAIEDLRKNYSDLSADFSEFYPQLEDYLRAKREAAH